MVERIKKKKKEPTREVLKEERRITPLGSELLRREVLAGEPTDRGIAFRTIKERRVADPATVRLRELAKGKERLLAGTSEFEQFKKEFPQLSRGLFDPEAKAFLAPSATPEELESEEFKFEQQRKERAELEKRRGEPSQRVQLDVERETIPFTSALEQIPIIGASAGVVARLLAPIMKPLLPQGEPTFPEIKALIQDPETERQVLLQAIQQKVIKEDLTLAEKFGSFVEAIPVVGNLVNKYASGLIETPSGNAATVLGNILNEKERALNTAEMVRSGRLDQTTALNRLDEIENNIVRLEQRLKILGNMSPILRADGDTINKFETEILRTRERVEDARSPAVAGALGQPTNNQLLLELLR